LIRSKKNIAMASGDVARCRNLCAALLLLSAILLVPAESSMKSIEQLVVRPELHTPDGESVSSYKLFSPFDSGSLSNAILICLSLQKSRRHRDASSSEYDVEALLRQEITIAVKRGNYF
jgi:hypothetical protein